jgi:hypothetical protein
VRQESPLFITTGTSQSDEESRDGANEQRLGNEECLPIKPPRKVTFVSPPHSDCESTDQGDDSASSPEENDNDEAPCIGNDAECVTAQSTTMKLEADTGTTDVIKVHYSENFDAKEESLPLVLRARVYNYIRPRFVVNPETWRALDGQLSFGVVPELPEGFSLHPETGTISGVASQAREEPTHHEITIGVPAFAMGMSLGIVPVTRCSIAMHIMD